ncbi:MAG: winged helix-turn-helix transcriptional regulator [Verrucomicrobiota bacterium]
MKSKLLRKLAKSQKYQILAEIKRSQGLSVSQLCERINLSYMGVKQHCVALEKDGYLDTWRRPKGMGRPEKAYRLTTIAQEFFPSEHTNFTSEILRSLEEVYGPAAPEKILYQIYQNQMVKMQGKVSGHTLEERARSFAQLRDQDGYMSEYYFNGDIQRHQIIEYNSPVLVIADQFKILTQLENTLIENVLGVKVQREEERISGLYKCQFTLVE